MKWLYASLDLFILLNGGKLVAKYRRSGVKNVHKNDQLHTLLHTREHYFSVRVKRRNRRNVYFSLLYECFLIIDKRSTSSDWKKYLLRSDHLMTRDTRFQGSSCYFFFFLFLTLTVISSINLPTWKNWKCCRLAGSSLLLSICWL